VAVPVLQNSPVLTDDDLIEIVLAASLAKQQAVAQREKLSTRVTETIVYSGVVEAVRTLAGNSGAQWTDTAYDVSLERFGGDGALQEALVMREHLSARSAAGCSSGWSTTMNCLRSWPLNWRRGRESAQPSTSWNRLDAQAISRVSCSN
jgi:hypothetical protein